MVKDPARRMPLEEVRQRLRPLIDDPDDPLYPGSPDAPTMEAAAITRPASVPRRRRGTPPPPPRASPPPPPGTPRRSPPIPGRCRAAPPAPDGPVPPRRAVPVARPRASSSRGPRVVLAGTLGGWAVTRSIGGQSPFTAQNVTTASDPTALDRDPLGFTIPVPTGWARYPRRPGRPAVGGVRQRQRHRGADGGRAPRRPTTPRPCRAWRSWSPPTPVGGQHRVAVLPHRHAHVVAADRARQRHGVGDHADRAARGAVGVGASLRAVRTAEGWRESARLYAGVRAASRRRGTRARATPRWGRLGVARGLVRRASRFGA